MAKKASNFGCTAADWPAEGDVHEDWDGVRWCAVCRSAWCPHCEPWLYERMDYMRTQRVLRAAPVDAARSNRGQHRTTAVLRG